MWCRAFFLIVSLRYGAATERHFDILAARKESDMRLASHERHTLAHPYTPGSMATVPLDFIPPDILCLIDKMSGEKEMLTTTMLRSHFICKITLKMCQCYFCGR